MSTSSTQKENPTHPAYQFLDLVHKQISLFGPQQGGLNLKKQTSPLLTIKHVFHKAILHELLWFISATNSNAPLSAVVGFRLGHFGERYVDFHTDYSRHGVDQLADVIHKLKNNPYDRRIVMRAWKPVTLGKMGLLPCRMFAQFYASYKEGKGKGALSCMLYQRICYMRLGVPLNIFFAGHFIHTTGDAQVYADHADTLKGQLVRAPEELSTLKVNRQVDDIDNLTFEDFELLGYDTRPSIKIIMPVWRGSNSGWERAMGSLSGTVALSKVA
ncbi:thymidylate synthase/dCMP hydroxymethylase domain-containing protein [Tuber indicum]|nr:thymidylate synthase/dCMP hydroxymethylase domain-containing protein [Tuber indicum]